MTNRTLPGASLDSILEQSSLPAADALRYALNLALALRSGHESGTVYRVLDPSRIYLSAHEAVIETASECNFCTRPRSSVAAARTPAVIFLPSAPSCTAC